MLPPPNSLYFKSFHRNGRSIQKNFDAGMLQIIMSNSWELAVAVGCKIRGHGFKARLQITAIFFFSVLVNSKFFTFFIKGPKYMKISERLLLSLSQRKSDIEKGVFNNRTTYPESYLKIRHIVVGHFVRSDTGHVMQAIDVTRHSRITQQLFPSTTALSFVCCSQFACKKWLLMPLGRTLVHVTLLRSCQTY